MREATVTETPTIQSPWLTVTEAATYSRRHPNTVWEALRDGSLPGSQTKRGGTWLIHRDNLDAWIRGEIASVEPARVARPKRTA